MPLPQQLALETPQRLDRHGMPLPQQSAPETPQRRTRQEEQDQPSRTLSTHKASGCTQPVGGTVKRWLAREVLEHALQYCRPGGPATANHLIHHDVLNKMSRRLGASGARNRSPRRKREIPAEMPVLGTALSERETKETTTPPTSARDKRARSTSAQPDERQPPVGPAKRDRKEKSGQLGKWPDIPPTWELLMSAATQKPRRNF